MIVCNKLVDSLDRICAHYHTLTKPNAIRLYVHVYDQYGKEWKYGPTSKEFYRFYGGEWFRGNPGFIDRVDFTVKANHPVNHTLYINRQSILAEPIFDFDRDDYFKHIAREGVYKLVLTMYGL